MGGSDLLNPSKKKNFDVEYPTNSLHVGKLNLLRVNYYYRKIQVVPQLVR